jgi:hypothetical protein
MTIEAAGGGFANDFSYVISSFLIFSRASLAAASRGRTLSRSF